MFNFSFFLSLYAINNHVKRILVTEIIYLIRSFSIFLSRLSGLFKFGLSSACGICCDINIKVLCLLYMERLDLELPTHNK